jgi:subtilisin-like proprotein convertase family protein
MKIKSILVATVALTALAANATLYSTNWNTGFANAGVVPDNNFSGWSDTRTVSTMPAGTFQNIAVNLQLSSGWTGDLYAYLVHSSGFSVLLDRVGTPGLTYGYGAGNINVTLADDGWSGGSYNNIHTYGGGNLSASTWNPDASGLTSSPGSLASFLSTSPNGTWSLFMSDLSGGGITTVQSWGLQMDIVAVPEVETWVAAILAGAFGAFWINRQIWGNQRRDTTV